MLLVANKDPAIADRLASELAAIESRFNAELISDLPCVNTLATHVERYRGKMLRPMLVLVSGLAAAPREMELTDAHRVVAAVVEMVHMATLVHDDVLDEAAVRRRGFTVNHLRGNETAVMLGDYLISHAYHLCSSLGSTRISRIIADATNTVCEGELLQLANRDNHDLDEPTYFEIIRRKTASLCGVCCRVGALLHHDLAGNGAQKLPAADALYQFGEKVGVAFQIIDDVLDLTGTQETVGKTLGRDLDKGKLTLPMIHHLRAAPAAARPAVMADLKAHREQVRLRLDQTHSVRYATDWASRLIAQAKEHLTELPDTPARCILDEMADAVLTRRF